MTGRKPDWPEVEKILTLAANTYRRLCNDKNCTWHTSALQKKKALNAQKPPSTSSPECWNCGGKHVLQECDKTIDQKRVAENRAKFLKKKRELQKQRQKGSKPDQRRNDGGGRGGGRALKAERKTKVGTDGTPLVLNVKGAWVPDQKTIRAKKRGEEKAALNSMITDLADQANSAAGTGSQATGSSTDAAAPAPAPASGLDEQVSRIRSAVDSMFG